jgi:hypothetical protein
METLASVVWRLINTAGFVIVGTFISTWAAAILINRKGDSLQVCLSCVAPLGGATRR